MTGCGGEGKGGVRMTWVTSHDIARTNTVKFCVNSLPPFLLTTGLWGKKDEKTKVK